MAKKPLWQKLQAQGIFTRKDLDRAVNSIRRSKSMSEREKDGEEWTCIIQFNNNYGLLD